MYGDNYLYKAVHTQGAWPKNSTNNNHRVDTVECKILDWENFGETVHTKNWLMIFYWMSKISEVPKINKCVSTCYQSIGIIEYSRGVWLTWNILPYTSVLLVIGYSHLNLTWNYRVEYLWWNMEAICTPAVSSCHLSYTT